MPSSLRYVLWWLGGCCVRDRWGETEEREGDSACTYGRTRARTHTLTHTGNQAV